MNLGPILMTVAIAQYGLIPPLADLNRSHALNPDWPPHARFHVTTQVATTSLISMLALGVLWSPQLPQGLRAGIAALASAAVLGGFFVGALASRVVAGAISAPHARRFGGFDGNVLNFAGAAVLMSLGWLLASS